MLSISPSWASIRVVLFGALAITAAATVDAADRLAETWQTGYMGADATGRSVLGYWQFKPDHPTVDASGHGVPVENAYVRLLDRTGEFTAEVPTDEGGYFRFFAGNGEWTLRTLAPRADVVDQQVTAQVGSVAEVAIAV